MQDDTETVEVEKTTTENENETAQGTTDSTATGSAEAESESTVQAPQEPTVSKAEYDKLVMERNQLRNKQDEDRRKALEESNEFKTLYEETQAKLAEKEQEEERAAAVREATTLRESFIDAYPDETVKKAAKALIERNPSNLSWGDVTTEDEAKDNIFSQLDALKETLGIISEAKDEEDEDPEILANNPSTNTNKDPVEELDWMKMREVLPKADPR